MSSKDEPKADFFADDGPDPVAAATGAVGRPAAAAKRKAGFYLPQPLLDRFNARYYALRLAGVPIANKSALLEILLAFALDELEREDGGRLGERIPH